MVGQQRWSLPWKDDFEFRFLARVRLWPGKRKGILKKGKGRVGSPGWSQQQGSTALEPQGATCSGDSANMSQSVGPWEGGVLELAAAYRAHNFPAPRSSGAIGGGGPAWSPQDLLTRVDEFMGMLKVLCTDSSHVVSEGVSGIYERTTQEAGLHLGRHTPGHNRDYHACMARVEEQVARIKVTWKIFLSTSRRLHTIHLNTIHVPSIVNHAPSSRPQQMDYKPLSCFGLMTTFSFIWKGPRSESAVQHARDSAIWDYMEY